MNKRFVSNAFIALSLVFVLLLVSACGSKDTTVAQASKAPAAQSSAAASAKPSEAPKTVAIKIAYPSVIDFKSVISVLGWENPTAGLKVAYDFMNTADLSVQGVVAGDYQIGAAPAITVLKAIESGIPIKIIAEQMKNEFTLLTPSSITKPEDLQGKILAIHGPNTLTDALVRSTVKKFNLDKAKILTIPGSDVRAQALLKGTIDATPADQSDVLNVEKNGGGKYKALINYAELYPTVNGTVFFTTDKYLKENRAVVVSFTTALLENYRKVYADPNFLKQNAAKYIKNFDQETINKLADIYIGKKILDLNGGISKESGDTTINFNKEYGLLTGDKVKVENSYDTSVVEEVIKAIGKK